MSAHSLLKGIKLAILMLFIFKSLMCNHASE